jgi:hypothetical protein
VLGAFPSRLSFRARSIVFFAGTVSAPSRKFLLNFYLHEIKTRMRVRVPLAHSHAVIRMRLGKMYTDMQRGIVLARLVA